MSTINSKNVQVGTSGTANQNFTLYQPASPDGTVRLGVGNSGATTLDAVTVTSAGNVTVAGTTALPAGSASAPALTTTGDTNTGVFFPAADTIAFAEGGTEVMRIDSSGQVGLGMVPNSGQGTLQSNRSISGGGPVTSGTSDPNQVAMISGGSVQFSYGAYPAGTGWMQMRATGNFAVNYDLVFQPNGGNVGIGTATPAMKLHVDQGTADQNSFTVRNEEVVLNAGAYGTGSSYGREFLLNASRADGGTFPFLRLAGQGGIKFCVDADTERMRIDSVGNLLVGATSTAIPTTSTTDVFLGGIIMAPSRRTTSSGANVNIDPTSGVFARSTSSLKYKKDVLNAPWGLADVMKLRAVTYKSVVEADGDTVFGGLIAEEIHDAGLTEFVQYGPDGSPDALAYGNMVSLCIKAIQELKAELDTVKTELAALKGAQA